MVLSHVCSRWRHIAAHYPPIWTIITHADFCNYRWIDTVLQRSGSCCALRVNFHAKQSVDKELQLLAFVQHRGKVKELSLVTDYETIQKLQSSHHPGWALGLEKLRICVGDAGQRDTQTDDRVQFRDYIAHVNAQHLPNLPFFGNPHKLNHEDTVPNLRHLSLTNCFVSIPLVEGSLSLYPNLERLEISHIPIECHHSVQSWSFIARALPHLKYLEIDGAMVWDPAFDKNFNEDTRLAKFPLLSQLTELRINRCTLACAAFLYNFSAQPRSWQFTCIDVRYDEEFPLFCMMMQMWLRSWDATVPNRYLFVSIQPDGIIVHNRSMRHNRGDATPVLQLALYWKAMHVGQRLLNMLSPLLNLIFTSEPHPNIVHPYASPLTVGCEELELSVGLFDYDDRKLLKVVTQALCHFRDVKKLTCIGGAGTVLASLTPQGRPARANDLLPSVDCIRFDHVNFDDGMERQLTDYIRLRSNRCQALCHIELDECRNVHRAIVTRLERAGTRVAIGTGTVLVDNDDSLEKNWEGATREPWTRGQVQVGTPPSHVLFDDVNSNAAVDEEMG
ncbi:hypothetical protein APHAL10511_005291 [Amanita phalloides]|nr:hypothetical protein APHAL10511_005291 [Amanita phalloides]